MKINELRRSSSISPKQNGVTQFMNYIATLPADELKRTYVSFTEIDKLGINPTSIYDTPLGIYAYPADYVRLEINRVMNSNGRPLKSTREISGFDKVVPFAGKSKFFNVFQVEGNIIDLDDEDQCREAKLDLMSTFNIKTDILPSAYKQTTTAEEFWSMALYIANGKDETPYRSTEVAVKWNRVFRKAGIDGVTDSHGASVIHGNEPTQAVFFSSSVIKNVKRFVNTANSGNTAKEPLRKEKLGNFFVKRILQTPNLVEKIKANFNSLWFHNCIAAHISDFKLHEKYLSTVVNLEEQIAYDIESAITNNQSFGKFLSAGYALSSKINYAVSSGRAAVNVYKIYPKDESSESVEAAVKQYLTPALKRDAWKAFVYSFINTMDTWINNMFRWGDGPDDFAEWINQNVPSHMQESHQVVKSGKLTELRKSSAVMPRKSGVQQLRDYVETLSAEQIDKSFVSFTTIDKLGINPKSKYDTPNGIYAYPLGSVLHAIQRDMGRTFSSILPFAGEAPYFNVFEVEGNVISLHEYNQVETTLKKLIDFGNKVAAANNKKMGALPEEYRQLYTAEELWSYSLYIANGFNEDPLSSPSIARKWATVFRKVGVDGVIDEGAGIIHENEPRQAVFFTSEVIKNVKRFVNASNNGSTGKKQPSTAKDGTFYMLKWIRIPEVRSSFLPLYKSMVENVYITIMTKDREKKQDAKNKVIDISKQITTLLTDTAKSNHLFGDVTDKVINDIKLPSAIDDDIYLNQRLPDWYYNEEVYEMPFEKMVQTIKRHLNGSDFNKVWKEFRTKLTYRVDNAYKTYN